VDFSFADEVRGTSLRGSCRPGSDATVGSGRVSSQEVSIGRLSKRSSSIVAQRIRRQRYVPGGAEGGLVMGEVS
jgi:hypothetical protein